MTHFDDIYVSKFVYYVCIVCIYLQKYKIQGCLNLDGVVCQIFENNVLLRFGVDANSFSGAALPAMVSSVLV